jgi:hypothetical protein
LHWLLDPAVEAAALLVANLLNFLATPSEALVFSWLDHQVLKYLLVKLCSSFFVI